MLSRKDGSFQADAERDFIKREIEKLVAFVARLVGGQAAATGLERQLADLHVGAGEILCVPIALLERLSVEAAAAMLANNPSRIAGYAAICEAEAELHERGGDLTAARRQAERAGALHRAAERAERRQ